jgi:hypothetical protein
MFRRPLLSAAALGIALPLELGAKVIKGEMKWPQ